mgnify:CR=1 FL=1
MLFIAAEITSFFVGVDADSEFLRDDVFAAPDFIAVRASELVLFNVNEDFIGHSQVNESVHSSLVFFHQFSLSTVTGVVQ